MTRKRQPSKWSEEHFLDEMIKTEMTLESNQIELELFIRKPETSPPYPTVLFNHGSMGRSRRKDGYRHPAIPPRFTKLLNSWGWMVIHPQRRGIGNSMGQYREGFCPDKQEYLCDTKFSLNGFHHAMEDMEQIIKHVASRTDVEHSSLVVGGESRGGALALAVASKHPNLFTGAFSFVGGWMGQGCKKYSEINKQVFSGAGAFKKPTFWLHGTRDRFYRLNHCEETYQSYLKEGGVGKFKSYPTGHGLIVYRDLYSKELRAYLDHCKLTI